MERTIRLLYIIEWVTITLLGILGVLVGAAIAAMGGWITPINWVVIIGLTALGCRLILQGLGYAAPENKEGRDG